MNSGTQADQAPQAGQAAALSSATDQDLLNELAARAGRWECEHDLDRARRHLHAGAGGPLPSSWAQALAILGPRLSEDERETLRACGRADLLASPGLAISIIGGAGEKALYAPDPHDPDETAREALKGIAAKSEGALQRRPDTAAAWRSLSGLAQAPEDPLRLSLHAQRRAGPAGRRADRALSSRVSAIGLSRDQTHPAAWAKAQAEEIAALLPAQGRLERDPAQAARTLEGLDWIRRELEARSPAAGQLHWRDAGRNLLIDLWEKLKENDPTENRTLSASFLQLTDVWPNARIVLATLHLTSSGQSRAEEALRVNAAMALSGVNVTSHRLISNEGLGLTAGAYRWSINERTDLRRAFITASDQAHTRYRWTLPLRSPAIQDRIWRRLVSDAPFGAPEDPEAAARYRWDTGVRLLAANLMRG